MEQLQGPGWPSMASLYLLLAGATCGPPERDPAQPSASFDSKVATLLAKEPEDPKCFTQRLEDFVCFWEERTNQSKVNYSFFYQLEGEPRKQCRLKVTKTARNTVRYTCNFPVADTSCFTPLTLSVTTGKPNSEVHNRTVFINQVVFLDPPSNLTVRKTEKPGQLHLRWLPPNIPHMTRDIRYEVNFSAVGADVQKVDILEGRTECLIVNLRGQTRYLFAVRAKLDDLSYNGYWSAWSEPATVLTASDLDPLILSLSLILLFILLLLAVMALFSNRRFLKKRIWPGIPSPEHEFEGLFTIHKGNFQLWLGQRNAYLWWGHRFAYLEDQPTLLEVLSELPWASGSLLPPTGNLTVDEVPLLRSKSQNGPGEGLKGGRPSREPLSETKDDYLVLDEHLLPQSPGGGSDSFHGQFHLRLLGSGSSVGTAPSPEEEEEEVEGEEEEGKQRSPSIFSALEPGQEERASASSFEYTVVDPSSKILSPRARLPSPAQAELKYMYLVVSDSGISADSSSGSSPDGPYSNLYENGCTLGPFPTNYVTCS
ncbi:erythropoietin receptor [Tachyglossus aculeatus]|uniref:erythropoietin receptor n=1 Tax=Tachyglossus aculeatus TaxID=9261 RepID=UPI0018F52549|nr:erythropoietin receptor [Tachyglossus aculeatus]